MLNITLHGQRKLAKQGSHNYANDHQPSPLQSLETEGVIPDLLRFPRGVGSGCPPLPSMIVDRIEPSIYSIFSEATKYISHCGGGSDGGRIQVARQLIGL